jgi:hypothetical protein
MNIDKIHETIADIAYIAGSKGYFTGDSRGDISEFIYWAKQFETINKFTDWNVKDYISKIEEFTGAKLKSALK